MQGAGRERTAAHELPGRASLKHFDAVKAVLDAQPTASTRGWCAAWDYQPHRVRVVTDKLGAQGTICGGGRYDGLIRADPGGKPAPGVGWGMGVERVLDLLQQKGWRCARRHMPTPSCPTRPRCRASWSVEALRRAGPTVVLRAPPEPPARAA